MPIIRSAIKKMRQDKQRKRFNLRVKVSVKEAIKKFRLSPSEKGFPSVMSEIDTAAKKHVFHTNKANRLKARLAKLLGGNDTAQVRDVSVKQKKGPAKKKTIASSRTKKK